MLLVIYSNSKQERVCKNVNFEWYYEKIKL